MGEYGITDEEIEVEQDDVFTIALESNPTTGYRWEVKYDGSCLELVFRKFHLSSERIGSAGQEIFEFKGLRVCETKVNLVYKREWEEEFQKTIAFLIKIK